MSSRTTPGGVPHIVHVASYGGPYTGSFIPMLVTAIRRAREKGYRNSVCFSAVARDRSWLPVFDGLADVTFADPSSVRRSVSTLRSILGDRRSGPAVLHTHFGQFDIAAALAARTRGRTATIWHVHSGSPSSEPPRLRTRMFTAVFGRLIQELICVSPQIYDDAQTLGFPRQILRLMPNAVDTERFSPISEPERAQARATLRLDPGCRVALQFAWHWTIKGGDRMLAAAAELEAMTDLRILIVVGEGSHHSPKQQILEHRNVTGLHPREDVRDLFAAADVFVNCSRSEGMPYAVLEALSCGLPVLATDLPVQREILGELPGAHVVAPDPESIAVALQDLLTMDAGQRSEHAAAARERVVRSYGLESWGDRLADLYEDLLKGRRGRL